MLTLYAVWIGFALDLLFGDPVWLPHPVVWMGRAIRRMEPILRRLLPKSMGGELWGGRILAAVLPLVAFLLCWSWLALCGRIHPGLRLAAESLCCYQIFAARELWRQSMLVHQALEEGGLQPARQAVSRIVGRDTGALDEADVIRAAVETVAENTADGVVAPLCFMMLGGAPLGMLYKAVNTLDSMVGYRNERYLHFGRASARLDDAANLLPSRFCALCMLAAVPWAGASLSGGWRVWRRDRRHHSSPNSAQTEAVCAGALGIRLGGGGTYFGKWVEKPTIGDKIREVTRADIRRANRLMLGTALLALLACSGIRMMGEAIIRWMG